MCIKSTCVYLVIYSFVSYLHIVVHNVIPMSLFLGAGLVSKRGEPTTEFTMLTEDFPALPGTNIKSGQQRACVSKCLFSYT